MYLYFLEETLIIILPLLGSIAFMTLAERKIMGLHKINKISTAFSSCSTKRQIPSFIYDKITGCIKPIKNFDLYNIDLSHFLIKPVKIYSDSCKFKTETTSGLKNVCGIYLWFNKINKKMYIGSGLNLSRRLSEYYLFFIERRTARCVTRGHPAKA